MSELLRLDFQRGSLIHEMDYLGTGVCTPAFQGKIFYKQGLLVYTQGRDDLPERMKIRGKELEKEEYLPLFDLIDTAEIGKRLGDVGEITAVLMVSRQDLLITHKHVFGTQVFLLGFLNEETGFLPACRTIDNEQMSLYYTQKGIGLTTDYGENGRIYIPYRITEKEDLDSVIHRNGCFVHTTDGVPKTILNEKTEEIFNLFSDTQNNNQLFVKVFFVDRKAQGMEDLHKILEEITPFTPQDKIGEFVVLIERFKDLVEFFKGKSVCYSLVQGQGSVKLVYEEEEEKWMQKAEKSLNTFTTNLKRMLAENRLSGVEGISLHHQVIGAIFTFFNYERNVNNCCHILKHFEKLTYVR